MDTCGSVAVQLPLPSATATLIATSSGGIILGALGRHGLKHEWVPPRLTGLRGTAVPLEVLLVVVHVGAISGCHSPWHIVLARCVKSTCIVQLRVNNSAAVEEMKPIYRAGAL